MGLYLKQDETRTQLSSKVAADLSQRLNKRAMQPGDANYVSLDNHRKTSSGGLFWTVLITIVVLLAAGYFIFIF